MSQYDETNRGALFTNDRKEQDNHPDLSGKINIEGREYWISGWVRRNDDRSLKVISLSVKPKEQRGRQQQPSRRDERNDSGRDSGQRQSMDDFLDDDIPF